MQFYLAILSFFMSFKVTPKKIISFLERICENDRDNTASVENGTAQVCAIQMRVCGYKNLRDYLREMLGLTQDAVNQGAQVIVFPEYVGLLSATLLPNFGQILYWFMDGETPEGLDDVQLQPRKTTMIAEALQNYLYECYVYTFSTLARLCKVYIVAGSCIVYEQGKLYNRSVIFDPTGKPLGAQDKTAAMCFDKALGIHPADQIKVFDTPIGKLSVILGSDAYYFENFRAAADAGARLIAVPDGRGGVMGDIVRCRANESGVYAIYACFSGARNKQVRSCILAPFEGTQEYSGTVAQTKDTKTGCVTAKLKWKNFEENRRRATPEFLQGDYLRSYFCTWDASAGAQDIAKLQMDAQNHKSSVRRVGRRRTEAAADTADLPKGSAESPKSN